MTRITRVFEEYINPFWTTEENIEMATRSWIKNILSDRLIHKGLSEDLEGLKGGVFDVVYPVKR
jgi:hypothetical protein